MAAAVFAGCDAALALERTGEVALVEEPVSSAISESSLFVSSSSLRAALSRMVVM